MSQKVIGRPFTKENAAEMGHKGGIESGKTRGYTKNIREALENELRKNIKLRDGRVTTGIELLASSMMGEAVKGNMRASELIVRLIEQFPSNTSKQSAEPAYKKVRFDFSMLSPTEQELLLTIGEKLINNPNSEAIELNTDSEEISE